MTDNDSVQAALARYFAPWVQQLGLRVQAVRAGEVVLLLPANPALCHHAGILCGQASMAAADTAMVLAISSDLGEFRPVTTVQFQSSFLRPLSGSEASVTARVLRRGRSLVFGEVEIAGPDGRLAVHSTTTCALL